MEFVGKTVKKEFKGLGVFSGIVKSYDSSAELFEIVYEDGDTEELDFSEVTSLTREGETVKGEHPVHLRPRVGRKPKKRRQVEEKPELLESSGTERIDVPCRLDNDGNFGSDFEFSNSFAQNSKENDCVDVNLNGNVDLVIGCEETLKLGNGSSSDFNGSDLRNGTDMNAGDLVRVTVDHDRAINSMDYIDLNMDVNRDLDESGDVLTSQKREVSGFDLNLELDGQVSKGNKDITEHKVEESDSLHVVEEISKMHETSAPVDIAIRNGELKEVPVAVVSCLELMRQFQAKSIVSGDQFDVNDCHEDQLKEGLLESGTKVIGGFRSYIGSSDKQGNGSGKRRKILGNSSSAGLPSLRRSTRKVSKNNNSSITSFLMDDLSTSPTVSGLTEDKPLLTGCVGVEPLVTECVGVEPLVTGCVGVEPVTLPLKLQLPESSLDMELDVGHVLDVFSIYACLRSFSTLLLLSPFEFEDFVGALNCKSSSTLLDSVHVSVLHTLRKHLKHLSEEGCQSASECLRSLNWDFLDMLTWPLFVVEYLLVHGSGLRSDFDLNCLKLLRNDYYKQPVVVKVEALRCLCDDMIESEAIRSELNRRSSAFESELDFDRNVNVESFRKKRATLDSASGLFSSDEVIDETTDWNSDECCLCKMDGRLICCDGCPAAYHSKCVGVVSTLLPEGEWYCPECSFDRNKSWVTMRRSLRGAELVGVDPHGRKYYSTCGYLLVLDTSDTETSFKYYNVQSLNAVLCVLKASGMSYWGIIRAIYEQWGILDGTVGTSRKWESLSSMCLDTDVKEQKLDKEYSGQLDTAVEIPYMSYEGSAGATQTGFGIQNCSKQVPGCYRGSAELLTQAESPIKLSALGDCLTPEKLVIKQGTDEKLDISPRTGSKSQVISGTAYMNRYNVAIAASFIAEELLRKSLHKVTENSIKLDEDIISAQLKVILKKSTKFSWPSAQSPNIDAQREKCGWCFSCKALDDSMDCLFNMSCGSVCGLLESEMTGFQSKRTEKGHLIDVICCMLSIENRLRGLLLGPWSNPHYTKLWQKSLLKDSDISCLKQFLLTLEANLNRLALSAEWWKLVDSATTLGSASHGVFATVRVSSKNGNGKKRGRPSILEVPPTSNEGGGLSMCWWRGGKISRQVFNWKVLPYSMTSKAARQAGRMKIPDISYPENSDFPKRSKSVAWRAAVEYATSVEQLAFLVRELDSNIKWDDIENAHPLPALDKETRKSIRFFKKAIIRRKCIEEDGIKYLLDFGKRRIIPDVVLKNGTMITDSSSDRKKYWLIEPYVPLHLLNSFEQKQVARKFSKLSPGKLSETGRAVKKSSNQRGLAYLLSKAERSQCGDCRKDVLIREAVCCQCCKDYFHKSHVKKGAIIAGCEYTCPRCLGGKSGKVERKTGENGANKEKISKKSLKQASQKLKKVAAACRLVELRKSTSLAGKRLQQSQKDKKVSVGLPLRRSARRAQYILQLGKDKKAAGLKKKKQKANKSTAKKNTAKKSMVKKNTAKKSMVKKNTAKKSTPIKLVIGNIFQRKRSLCYYSYWRNGLLLSSKPDDERVMQFSKDKYFSHSDDSPNVLDPPKCLLCCESVSASTSSYIACEICGEWFHGDAYGLNTENKSKVIGFRCHLCRKRSPPECPHRLSSLERSAEEVAVQTQTENINQSHSTKGLSPVDEIQDRNTNQSHSTKGLSPLDEIQDTNTNQSHSTKGLSPVDEIQDRNTNQSHSTKGLSPLDEIQDTNTNQSHSTKGLSPVDEVQDTNTNQSHSTKGLSPVDEIQDTNTSVDNEENSIERRASIRIYRRRNKKIL